MRPGQNLHPENPGNQDIGETIDALEQMNLGILFAMGGDGTLRGASAISREIEKRRLKVAVIGVPKPIDNDISYIKRSVGFSTAVSGAGRAISSAHNEFTHVPIPMPASKRKKLDPEGWAWNSVLTITGQPKDTQARTEMGVSMEGIEGMDTLPFHNTGR
jgi:hypothetical protein